MDAEDSIKMPIYKGVHESKDTVFDVKFKNDEKRNRGKGGNCF